MGAAVVPVETLETEGFLVVVAVATMAMVAVGEEGEEGEEGMVAHKGRSCKYKRRQSHRMHPAGRGQSRH